MLPGLLIASAALLTHLATSPRENPSTHPSAEPAEWLSPVLQPQSGPPASWGLAAEQSHPAQDVAGAGLQAQKEAPAVQMPGGITPHLPSTAPYSPIPDCNIQAW